MTDSLVTRLLAARAATPRHHASCTWIKGKWQWYIGMREGGILCSSSSHTTLIQVLKQYMRRNGITVFSFTWDNDNRVETVHL